LKRNIGEKGLLKMMLTFGIPYILITSMVSFGIEDEGTVKKLCTHFSVNDIEIFNSYQVIIIIIGKHYLKSIF
jgi:hypothetical protein